ncbi:MAG: hypothetical protein Fur005_33440 [Roseiflexaceae bacterium]
MPMFRAKLGHRPNEAAQPELQLANVPSRISQGIKNALFGMGVGSRPANAEQYEALAAAGLPIGEPIDLPEQVGQPLAPTTNAAPDPAAAWAATLNAIDTALRRNNARVTVNGLFDVLPPEDDWYR